jgi:ketosteroid isomerase-like protein
MRLALAAALATLPLAGCVRNIPNTEIPDTVENRTIIRIVDDYRKAFDRRDVDAVMALVSRSYFDDAGTSDKSDDVDYANLPKVLTDTFSRLSQMRLELGVTNVFTKGDDATVDLFYDALYKVTTRSNQVAKRDSDVQRLMLKREGPTWKIVSGL